MEVDSTDGDGDTGGINMVRKERDLTIDEKRFLLAVEHGDMPKVTALYFVHTLIWIGKRRGERNTKSFL